MEHQVLMDKLSEFLMVEQAGVQLYTVAAERTSDKKLKNRYVEFGRETERHREILMRLIDQLGGDPNYISPTARVAQLRGQHMLSLALQADGLSPEELDMVDLESVALAETKDHADWELLGQLVEQVEDESMRKPIQDALSEVGTEEEEHRRWALDKLAERSMEMVTKGPAPPPDRWEKVWSGPHYTGDGHPAMMEKGDGLLKPATGHSWDDALVARATKGQ